MPSLAEPQLEASPRRDPVQAWTPATRFACCLAELEESAQQPVPPTRPGAVTQRLVALFSRLERAWHALGRINEELHREIVTIDPALGGALEQVNQEEVSLISEFLVLWERALTISRHASSASAVDDARRLRRDVLVWLEAMQSHEQDLTTWLIEAHYRDRGGQG